MYNTDALFQQRYHFLRMFSNLGCHFRYHFIYVGMKPTPTNKVGSVVSAIVKTPVVVSKRWARHTHHSAHITIDAYNLEINRSCWQLATCKCNK